MPIHLIVKTQLADALKLTSYNLLTSNNLPTILLPQVRVPSTQSTLFSFIFVQYLSCEKDELKTNKEAGFGPFDSKRERQTSL